jgi:hypothetical protein
MGPNGDTMAVGSFKMSGGGDIKSNDVTQTASNNWIAHTEKTVCLEGVVLVRT